MRKAVNKKIVSMLFVTVIASLILAVYRTYLLFNCVEPDTGFYMVGTSQGYYFNLSVIALSVFLALGTLLLKKVEAPTELKSESTTVVFASSLCGFLFLTVLGYGIFMAFKGAQTDVWFWIEMLICIPCMINFFVICSKEQRDRNVKQTVLSLMPAVFFAVRTVSVFTDVKTQINVSQRSLTLVMLCAMMMFFVCETAFFLPENTETKETENQSNAPSLVKYFFTGIFTVAFAVIAVLPYLTVTAFWMYESKFLLMDILDASVGLYALTRLISLARS